MQKCYKLGIGIIAIALVIGMMSFITNKSVKKDFAVVRIIHQNRESIVETNYSNGKQERLVFLAEDSYMRIQRYERRGEPYKVIASLWNGNKAILEVLNTMHLKGWKLLSLAEQAEYREEVGSSEHTRLVFEKN